MKTFKLSQSKDDNLLKISSKKTNYEIKLTDNELLELRTELGFNEVKIEPQEIKTEKQIDWRNLSFDDWMSETKKLNLSYDDLFTHINEEPTCSESIYFNNFIGKNIQEKTKWVYNQLNPIDWKNLSFPEWFYQTSKLEFSCHENVRAHYMSDKTSIKNCEKLRLFYKKLGEENNLTTKTLYKILTNTTMLKVGDVVNIGEYEFSVYGSCLTYGFYLKHKNKGDTFKLFEEFGITNNDIHSRFNTTNVQCNIFPETKTLKELTKIYYYLKTFEV